MKKNLYKKTIVAGLALFSFGLMSANNVKADDNNGLPSESTTHATANFTDDDGNTTPVDPTDPSKSVDPDDNNNENNNGGNHTTDNKGTLTLDVVPSSFIFNVNASNNEMSVPANGMSNGNNNQYLQVSDKRTDANGWNLNVQQESEFTDSSNDSNINGTTVTIPKGDARNSLNDNPASTEGTGLTTNEVKTTVGEDQIIFSAPNQEKTGKSVSTDTFQATDVKLNVPKYTAKKGNFSTNIKWSLVAGA